MNSQGSKSTGPLIIAALVTLLVILHQDTWFWTDSRLVFGFMPIGLAWHAGLSLAAAATWWLATRIAWPLEETPPRHANTNPVPGQQEGPQR